MNEPHAPPRDARARESDDAHWSRVRELLNDALERDEAARVEYLDQACADDPTLRAEVVSLLAAAARSGPLEKVGAVVVDPLLAPLRDLAGDRADDGTLAAGQRLGPYRIVGEIGTGGMGVVYLAERDDWGFARRVAVKLVRAGIGGAESRRRFLHERDLVARLEHPHIARLLDAGVTDEGLPYIVMEYVEGEPIDRYCDTHRLSIERRLRLFCDLCSAVEYAHRNLIVHRDLKPGNVLVTGPSTPESAAGEVKLLDFGIAKLIASDAASDATLTRTGMRPMTPGYASPEQVRGEPVTTATDVYALGVLLYELLSGRSPYRLESSLAHELERAICEQEPLRPSTVVMRAHAASGGAPAEVTLAHVAQLRGTMPAALRRQLAGDLDTIVGKAIAKEPARRYDSVQQLREDIERHLSGLPVRARAPTVRYRAAKFVRRHRVGVAAAALVLVALLAGVAGTLWQARVAAQERDRARIEADRAGEVSRFVTGLFRSSDPAEARGATITAQELLDRGVARLGTLRAQPEIRATMMGVLGQVYRDLGRYEQARPLLDSALALRRQTLGAAHPDVAESLTHLAELYAHQGKYDDAEPLLRQALDVRRAALGPEHDDIASALNNLGAFLHQRGQLETAEGYVRQAVAMRRSLGNDTTADFALSLVNLAYILRDRGDLATADSLYRAALVRQRAALGPDHPDVATTMNNLAVLLFAQGEHAAAEPLMREVLDIRRRILPPDHPDLARSVNNLAAVLEKLGHLEAAEPLYREALDQKLATLGPEHPSVAISLGNLGLLLLARRDTAAAAPLLQQSLDMRRKLLGNDHPNTATAILNLGALHEARGQTDQALSLYREALAVRERVLGPDNAQTVAVRNRIQRLERK